MTDDIKNTIIKKRNYKTGRNHFFKDFEKGIEAKCYETATLYTHKEAEAIVARTPVDYDEKIISIVLYTFEKFCHAGLNCEIRYRTEPFNDWIGYVLLDKGHPFYGVGDGCFPDEIPTYPDVCRMDEKGRWNLGFDNHHLDQHKSEGEKEWVLRDTETLAEFLANYKGEE